MASEEAEAVAELLAGSADGGLLSKIEWALRDAVHRMGGQALDAAANERAKRKRGSKEAALPAAAPRRLVLRVGASGVSLARAGVLGINRVVHRLSHRCRLAVCHRLIPIGSGATRAQFIILLEPIADYEGKRVSTLWPIKTVGIYVADPDGNELGPTSRILA